MPDEPLPILANHIYRAKTPRRCVRVLAPDLVNDRQVLWVGSETVQYDSPSVPIGRHYPTVKISEFQRWAGEDVTAQYFGETKLKDANVWCTWETLPKRPRKKKSKS